VTGTFQAAIDKINALASVPDLILHKPGISAKSPSPASSIRSSRYCEEPGQNRSTTRRASTALPWTTAGAGWPRFDHKGIHFVGLNNLANLKAGGMGALGNEQLEWLEDDLKGRSASTPIVVFAHIPLWAVYPQRGWGTQDSAEALSYLKRFGSVTVLNGHIHQITQKVEGNVSFHTAMATPFPQPVPGTAPLSRTPDGSRRRVAVCWESRTSTTSLAVTTWQWCTRFSPVHRPRR
jgi:3',5'-cyclic AMP phosphodiesterase CpdA